MPLRGAIAAAVTPMIDAGAPDGPGIKRLASFLFEMGIDGVLTCGTTGEGVLLSIDERRRVTEHFLDARPDAFQIAVHAGAQTTADTVALAAHAKQVGCDAVAVIAPPYFPLDENELFEHMRAAAEACHPVAFYAYEFSGRSGYSIPTHVVERLRDEVPNLQGLKVSDSPLSAIEPYLGLGVDVFIGQEPLALEGMALGAVGSVSGLASAWPEIVSSLVHDRSRAAHQQVIEIRERLQGIPFHAALKETLVARGVLSDARVRPPLRGLSNEERRSVLALNDSLDQSRPALRQAP